VDSNGNILFAGHSERYSKLKNDKNIDINLINEIKKYNITSIAYYEKPFLKQLRQLYSGQGIERNKLTASQIVKDQLYPHTFDVPVKSFSHHLSHAAAGFQTSPFERATVVVIDAIGEWDTISIWGAEYNDGQAKYKKLWSRKYPHSIGLFYTAMTQRVGLTPMEDEYILMGMAAYGDKNYANIMSMGIVQDEFDILFRQNLHIGANTKFLGDLTDNTIAASTQELTERLILNVMIRARSFKFSSNLVYMGGVALNCKANARIGRYFDNIWIMPNPGDSGSSLGAAALKYGKRINWTTAYLGHNIEGNYPVNELLSILLRDKIVGVASGRAEFGPRALGNRSLLADPRGNDIKDKVNAIKQRQEFRPFAPVILEELASEYFDMPTGWSDSHYMQTVARCKYPNLFPAIVHHDGTSRVQTVPKDGSGIRQLLEKWFLMTDCPMLLNTSLNVKGEPIVNDRLDADRFETKYGVKVLS
jgi:carbamoyltransferase